MVKLEYKPKRGRPRTDRPWVQIVLDDTTLRIWNARRTKRSDWICSLIMRDGGMTIGTPRELVYERGRPVWKSGIKRRFSLTDDAIAVWQAYEGDRSAWIRALMWRNA